MADKRTNIIFRFGIVYFLIVIAFVMVIVKIVIVQTTERDNWLALQDKSKKTDIIVKPKRGNIYACDGRLMASSIPTYYVYMDMRVPALHANDGKLFYENIDSVALSLSKLFKDKSVNDYKKSLTSAYKRKEGRYPLYPKRIPYYQLKELRTFPLFRLGRYRSGLITEEYVQRVKPFGSLASRTIGDVYADESKGGKNGLELFYNTLLTGKPGFSTRQKVANTWQEIIEVEPVEGMDVITTIDIDIQDISEHALLDILQKYHAKSGYAIMMETKTGEIKSIVNMYRNDAGTGYYEKENGAVSDMMEPGSTFKTIVLTAAIDDGKVKMTDSVDVGSGTLKYHPRVPHISDHNANKGGYGKITVAEVIHGSSNVGMHKIVLDAYGSSQGELVDKIRQTKITEPMQLEILGAGNVVIKHPKENKDWSNITSLSAISRGYEVRVPAIYTLTYYNAIANDGKMIRPLFVKSVNKDGQVVKAYKTETINSSICKSSTLDDIREALLGVVEGKKGTAKPAHSDVVRIAGKTGTARVANDKGAYTNKHRVSFCGYFPADNPQYTGIVVITEPVIAAAGLTSGVVFKNIAERTMALKSDLKPKRYASDSINMENIVIMPKAKAGNYKALQTVMKNVKLTMSGESDEWVKTAVAEDETKLQPMELSEEKIPDVRGMGAKDAVYLLEGLGLKVQIQGRGKVVTQSVNPGTEVTKGRAIMLNLKAP